MEPKYHIVIRFSFRGSPCYCSKIQGKMLYKCLVLNYIQKVRSSLPPEIWLHERTPPLGKPDREFPRIPSRGDSWVCVYVCALLSIAASSLHDEVLAHKISTKEHSSSFSLEIRACLQHSLESRIPLVCMPSIQNLVVWINSGLSQQKRIYI